MAETGWHLSACERINSILVALLRKHAPFVNAMHSYIVAATTLDERVRFALSLCMVVADIVLGVALQVVVAPLVFVNRRIDEISSGCLAAKKFE